MSDIVAGIDYGPLEFTIRRFQIVQLAEQVLPAVPSGATLPVNSCFRVTVSAEPARLEIAARSAQMSIYAETEAVSAAGEGVFYLPAKKLRAILAAAPEGDISVAVKGAAAKVTAALAVWDLRLPAPDGYVTPPDLAGAEFFKAHRHRLAAALLTVRHAVGKDSGRPAMNQVSIAEHGGVMCATAVEASQFSRAPVADFPLPVNISGAALNDLVKLLAKSSSDVVEVADFGASVLFRTGPVTLAVTKSNAPFPSADDLFLRPAVGNTLELTADKARLEAMLSRVRVNCDASTSAVALIAENGRLTVCSQDKEGNSAEETAAADWAEDREVIVVNSEFLAAMLASHPSPVCKFSVGRGLGRVRPPLVLADEKAGVTGACTQMPLSVMGMDRK
jgi:DNA polymerase III sliding clamp (beta) subunit (PCNA family)